MRNCSGTSQWFDFRNRFSYFRVAMKTMRMPRRIRVARQVRNGMWREEASGRTRHYGQRMCPARIGIFGTFCPTVERGPRPKRRPSADDISTSTTAGVVPSLDCVAVIILFFTRLSRLFHARFFGRTRVSVALVHVWILIVRGRCTFPTMSVRKLIHKHLPKFLDMYRGLFIAQH